MATKRTPEKKLAKELRHFLKDRFNLHEDEASEKATIADIKDDVVFRGANLWILMFAIIVCSVGLDVNSTAVVIGAMLISPLMGPIMGVGLGIGIYDFELIMQGMKNLFIAMVISILTSALYFWVSPLDNAQSELLARTSPTLWDVFIAFFGGLTGIIASSRKEKSNAIPGVAIATALMPPLCTAGFGIATAQWSFFFGALYLFFINSVFISISTYLIISLLGYSKKEFVDKARETRVKRYILTLGILVILPSIYTGYMVVRKSLFEKNANHYIQDELSFDNNQVINANIQFEEGLFKKGYKRITVTLFGQYIDSILIAERKTQLNKYNLTGTELVVLQGYQGKEVPDKASLEQLNMQLKTGIIEELYAKNESMLKDKENQIRLLESEILRFRSREVPITDLSREIKAINDKTQKLSVASVVMSNVDSMTYDTLFLAYAEFKTKPKKAEITQIESWLKARLKGNNVKLIIP